MLRVVPCAVGGVAASARWKSRHALACQEPSKPSYYGSYSGDRFGGGIGQRVGIDEKDKRAIPGTAVQRVQVFAASHGSLREWATQANWREATRIHKAAYFTRTTNEVQEEVIDRIRQHYVSCVDSLDHCLIEAALFRFDHNVDLSGMLSRQVVQRIPSLVHGVFDEKRERCVVDFANKRLGGGWLSYGMVQEEKMFAERFDLGALCARALLDMPGDPEKEPLACAFSMHQNEAWLLRGAPAYAEIGWYGRTPKDALSRFQLLNPVDDVDTTPTVVAIDAIKADFPTYQKGHLEMMLVKAYTGFVAAKCDDRMGGSCQIATGSWGCGAFYNNERVMFVVQALAANLAGVELTYHVLGDGFRLAPAFAFLEEALVRKRTLLEVLDMLAEKCASDPEWRTKYKMPTAQKESATRSKL